MKTKFTKGEWVVTEKTEFNSYKYTFVECGYKRISTVYDTWQVSGQANAKLIAAAPDLFKALTLLLDEFESEIEDAMHLTADNIPAIVYAKAAIKKATE